MGGCLSNISSLADDGKQQQYKKKKKKKDSRRSNNKADMVNVITGKGDLRQYTVPVTASQVLLSEKDNWFLCNSDSLYYDDYIQALDLEEELESGQIYFMLPTTKLHYPLAASDMAALAVKASLALQHNSSSSSYDDDHLQRKIRHNDKQQQQQQQRRRRNISSKVNKAQISPFLLANDDDDDDIDNEQQNQLTLASSSSLHHHHPVLRKQSLSNEKSSSDLGVSKSMRKLQRYSSTRAKMAVRSFRLRLTTIYEGSVLHFYS